MNKTTIIILVISIIILIILYKLYEKIRYRYLNKIFLEPRNAKKDLIFNKTNLKSSSEKYPLSWTFSFWIYIDDWSYRYNSKKYIIKCNNCNIWLSERTSDLNVEVPTYDNKTETVTAKDMPIQKWLHICVSLENRNLDVLINGELHNSKYLNNVPILNDSDLLITPDGGYSGQISSLRYYSKPISKISFFNIDTVTHLFSLGPICSLFCKMTNMWDKMKNSIKGSIKIDVDVDVSLPGNITPYYN